MTLNDIVGQDRAIRILKALLSARRYPPLLFCGPVGTGKRTAALLYAQAANCESDTARPCGSCRTCIAIARLQHPDVRLFAPFRPPKKRAGPGEAGEKERGDPDEAGEIESVDPEGYALGRTQPPTDPSLLISIRVVRWIRAQVARPPASARLRTFVLLQAHRLTPDAANALLKTLEELPVSTTMVLTTDTPEELPATIRSRCQTVRFGWLPPETLAAELKRREQSGSLQSAGSSLPDASRPVLESGSLGAALRTMADPDAAAARATAELLAAAGPKAGLEVALDRDATGVGDVAGAALQLYREALRLRLGVGGRPGESPDAVRLVARRCATEELCRIMWALLRHLSEARTNAMPALARYSLAAVGLRPAG